MANYFAAIFEFNLAFFLAAVLIVGVLVFAAVSLTSHKVVNIDKTKYQADFLAVENALDKLQPKSWNETVMELDKMLDEVLRELGYAGETMADRLRAANSAISNINAVWYVHKLRNEIAHTRKFSVGFDQAKRAVVVYRRALQDLDVI
ncbi:MAG: hypothetical protein LBM12_01100 [Candidatus Nomurabacteria bacterium]|jgi:hypothetical protein|nr:hypothetical protein [Candidatus Nomurabacteria bacterium]